MSPPFPKIRKIDPIRVVRPTKKEQEVLKGEREEMSVLPGLAEWTQRYQKEGRTKDHIRKAKLRGKQLQGGERLVKLAKGLTNENLLVGLTQGKEGVEVRKLSGQKASVARIANQLLRTWCAEQGFELHWTTLEVKVDGEQDWHEDDQARGPMLVLVCGRHLGGELELWGYKPEKLENEVMVVNSSH